MATTTTIEAKADDAQPLSPIIASTVVLTKPGWQTSEFWLKVLAFVLTLLYASGVVPTTGAVAQAIAMIATMLGALGYTVMRTMAKRPANDNAQLADARASFALERSAGGAGK